MTAGRKSVPTCCTLATLTPSEPLSAALPAPFVIRVAVGLPSQEDLTVASTEPLHGQGEDGRFRLRLAIPTRFAHQAGELLRHVELTRVQGDALVVLRGGGLTQL